MKRLPLIALLWAVQGHAAPDAPNAASGWNLYLSGKFDLALDSYERTLAKDWNDSAARIGRVRALWRLGRYEEAVVGVRGILRANPNDGVAATVYADLLQPNRNTGYANADSCWAWVRKAVSLDPGRTEAWLSYWIEATMRGDDGLADEAIRRLARLGMWTRGTLAFDSVVLASAPENAVLILNGDADLLGMRQLQVVGGFRPDVRLEGSLLAAPRYWHNRVRKGLLQAPFDSAEIDHVFDDAPDSIPAATALVAELNAKGKWPVVAVFNMTSYKDWKFLTSRGRDMALYWLIDGRKEPASIDELRKMEAPILAMDPGDYAGPPASAVDESPIRRNAPSMVYGAASWTADLSLQLIQRGETSDFETLGAWIARFLRKARPEDPATTELLRTYSAWQEKVRMAIAESQKKR